MKEKNRSKRHPRLYALFVRPTHNEHLLFVRYLLPGITGSVADLAVLVLLTEWIIHCTNNTTAQQIAVYIATGVAFICGLLVNFWLSRRLVFKHMESRAHSVAGEFSGHLLVGVIGLFFTEALMWGGIQVGLHYTLAKVLASLIVFFWNYSARRWFLYKRDHHHHHHK